MISKFPTSIILDVKRESSVRTSLPEFLRIQLAKMLGCKRKKKWHLFTSIFFKLLTLEFGLSKVNIAKNMCKACENLKPRRLKFRRHNKAETKGRADRSWAKSAIAICLEPNQLLSCPNNVSYEGRWIILVKFCVTESMLAPAQPQSQS